MALYNKSLYHIEDKLKVSEWHVELIYDQNYTNAKLKVFNRDTSGSNYWYIHCFPNQKSFQITFHLKLIFPNLWVQLVKEYSVQLMGKLVQTLVLCSKGSKGEK